MTYSRKNKHKGRYPFKKRSGQYKRRQQGCATAKRRDVDKENDDQDHNIGTKSDDGRK